MKRGVESKIVSLPSKSRKTEEENTISAVKAEKDTTVSSSTLPDLPPDMWQVVLSHLPAYQHFGLKRGSLVAKEWFKLLPQEITFDEIMASCIQDPSEDGKGALYLLAHKSCKDNLTFNQLMSLCGCHIELTKRMLNDEELLNVLIAGDFINLGQHHEELASHLLTGPALEVESELSGMGQYHLAIAKQFLERHKQDDFLADFELEIMASSHVEIALDILDTPILRESCTMDGIVEFSSFHLSAARRVLALPELCNRLDAIHLAVLGSRYLEIAQDILNKHGDKFDGTALAFLAENNIEIAKFLLDDKILRARLDGKSLAMLVDFHPTLIGQIFYDPVLRAKLSLDDLAHFGHDVDIGLQILTLPDLDWQGKHLARLGRHKTSVAKHILEAPLWRCKLSGDNLAVLGALQPVTAKIILNDPELCTMLNSKNLVKLGKNDVNIALMILANPACCALLQNEHLRMLGEKHVKVAKEILTNRLFSEKISETLLVCFDEKHPGIGDLILATPHLHQIIPFDPDNPETNFQGRANVFTRVQKLAQELYKELYAEELYIENAPQPVLDDVNMRMRMR